jgi:hypothetical protein
MFLDVKVRLSNKLWARHPVEYISPPTRTRSTNAANGLALGDVSRAGDHAIISFQQRFDEPAPIPCEAP